MHFDDCTNRDGTARLTYHIEMDELGESPVVMVTKAGQLVSAAGSGHASLVVTAHEDFGVNQTIVILVKVNPFPLLGIRDKYLQIFPGISRIFLCRKDM